MAEQMVMRELLKNDCGKDCKGMLGENLKKKMEIVILSFFAVALIISFVHCCQRFTREENPYSDRLCFKTHFGKRCF